MNYLRKALETIKEYHEGIGHLTEVRQQGLGYIPFEHHSVKFLLEHDFFVIRRTRFATGFGTEEPISHATTADLAHTPRGRRLAKILDIITKKSKEPILRYE